MKLLVAGGLFAAAVIAAPASAQTVMTDFSFDDLRLVFADLKDTVTDEDTNSDGIHFIEAKTEGGLSYVIYGRQCATEKPLRCTGAQIMSSFTIKSARLAEAIQAIDYAAVSDFAEDDELKLSRYLIFDGGITRENLKTNLTVFRSIADKAWDLLTDGDYF
ncbi:MAG: hypothetical protein Q8R02_01035 [Hyphomonadaceae bacterium]|nr:hypothetical protein [Hyphomonadaceae bacterium]